MSGVSIRTYVLCVTSPLSLAPSRVSWLPLPVRVEGGRRQEQGGRAAALINGRAELLVFIGLGNPPHTPQYTMGQATDASGQMGEMGLVCGKIKRTVRQGDREGKERREREREKAQRQKETRKTPGMKELKHKTAYNSATSCMTHIYITVLVAYYSLYNSFA